MTSATLFLGQFVRSPLSVGSVLPSSTALARAMVAPIDFAAAKTILELGPGTGSFTREIATRLTPGCRYLGVELNPNFARTLSNRFPRLDFVQGDAGHLAQILASHGVGSADAIVSGLPWAWLPGPVQEAVFGAMSQVLVPSGLLVTFGYLQALVLPGARVLRRLLPRYFVEVKYSPIVWRNVPPAFAYICRK
jgi:phospholipid N-methyltransferase